MRESSRTNETCSYVPLDVPVPTQYGLPYEDLELDTADHVKVHAYLLKQRADLPDGSTSVEAPVGISDDEASSSVFSPFHVAEETPVCCVAPHRHHVSRQWRECWTSNTVSEGVLHEVEVQCTDVVIPRVRY